MACAPPARYILSISNIRRIEDPTDCSLNDYYSFDVVFNSTNTITNTYGQPLAPHEFQLWFACLPLDPITCNQTNDSKQCGKIVGDIANPYVENIRGNWRVKKSCSYLTDRKQTNQGLANMHGNIREDGIYNTFNPFWKYTTTWTPIYQYQTGFDKWIKNPEEYRM